MHRLHSLALKVGLSILAIPLLLLAVVFGCWLLIPDEAPDPDVQRLLAPVKTVPAADNMYYAIMGFNASADRDAHQVGTQILAGFAEWQTKHASAKPDSPGFDFAALLGNAPLKRPDNFASPCRPESTGCLADIERRAAELDAEITRNTAWLARYRALRAYPAYSELVVISTQMPLPQWTTILHASDLVDAEIAKKMAAAATRQSALDELAAEVRFYERLGTNADLLITRMVAAAALERKYRLASELLARYPGVVKTHAESLGDITRPLPSQWARLQKVADGEFRWLASAHQDISRDIGRQMTLGMGDPPVALRALESVHGFNAYRPQATLNALARQSRRIGSFYSAPARDIVQGRAEFEQDSGEFNLWAPRNLLYNPIGKVLLHYGRTSWGEYALRLHDVDGLSRLLFLQRLAIEAGFKADASPEILTPLLKFDSRLFDPYTQQPMEWEAAEGALRFTGRSERAARSGPFRARLPS